MAVGAGTLKEVTGRGSGSGLVIRDSRLATSEDGFGFEGAPGVWKGKVVSQTEREMVTDRERPARWPAVPAEVKPYVLVDAGQGETGFSVRSTGKRRIAVERFPLRTAERFVLPAVQWREE